MRIERKSWREALLIAILLVVGAMLRWEGIGREPVWLDELYSMELSAGRGYAQLELPMGKMLVQPPDLTSLSDTEPWWKIWPRQSTDAHPPLYFLLLRGWRRLAGESGIATRAMSMCASLISVVLVYLLGRGLYRPAVGAWAAALMSASPIQILYAREARPYALATTFALAAALASIAIHRHGLTWRRALILVSSFIAMLLTHYLTAGVAIALTAWLMIVLRGRDRTRTVATIAIGGVIYLALWGPVLYEQSAYIARNSRWLKEDSQGHVLKSLRRVMPMPLELLAPVGRTSLRIAPLAVILFVLPLLVMKKNLGLLLPVLWVACGLGLVAIADIASSTAMLNQIRFSLIAAPGICLLLAGLVAHQDGRLWHMIPAAGLIYCLTSLPVLHDRSKEDWREVAQWIGRDAGAGTVVILASTDRTWDWESAPGTLYLGVRYYQAGPGIDYVLIDRPADPALMAQLRHYSRVYLVNGWPKHGPVEILPDFVPIPWKSQRMDRIGTVFKMAAR